MCVAVPGLIVEACGDGFALVDFMGARRRVALDLVEDARPGDYLLVHAGFAIQKLDREEAHATVELLRGLAGTP